MPDPQTIKIISLIVTFIFIVLLIKDKFYGLLAYACIMFTMPGLYFPLLAKIRFELIVALIVLTVIMLTKEGRSSLSLSRNPISRNLFIFFLVVIISMIQAIDFSTAYNRTWEFAKIYAFYMMILALVKTEGELKIFLWTFVLLIAWIGYEPIYNFLSGVVIQRGEVEYATASKGRGGGHVALGIYLLQGLAFVWYLIISEKNSKIKLFGLFLLAIILAGIVVSGSRGAIVGLVMAILAISYFSQHRILYLFVGSLIVIAALLSMDAGYLSYMSTILDFGKSDVSAQSRFTGLINGIDMLIKRPILGVGPGCYPVARKLWFGWGLWSHNIYGQLAGDLGLVGIFAWSMFVYSYLKKCFLIRKTLDPSSWHFMITTAIVVSNIICLVLGFFAHMLYGYFWYMSAAIVMIIEEQTKQPAFKAA
jgi:O-antigen ligase